MAIQWLVESGYEVIACCLDVGEGKNLDFIKEKPLLSEQVNPTRLMRKKNLPRILR